jgi:maltooligosyltrehalose trehalohydrolase
MNIQYFNNRQCVFSVWAPLRKRMMLHIVHPTEQTLEMHQDAYGYFTIEVSDVAADAKYFYRPEDEEDFPDPASHYQPDGVHGPSQIVNHRAFEWKDQLWRGLPFNDLVLYELHVGTFTPEGTFEAIIPRLNDLVSLGINAIEIMPVAQFPGDRNWGYDSVYPYAVQNSYGGAEGLKKLVDACHAKGIAVFLDVVYNHLGPEGNYLPQFGPYFTRNYCTPWGDAINFDDAWSDGVREYFCNNVLYWFEYYHLDGLRLDAVHMMFDKGAVSFWEYTHRKLQYLQQKLGRSLYLIAESDLNSPKVIKHPEAGGYGFTAQWLDDFHHALYTLLDVKGKERYIDFGQIEHLAKAYTDGFVHSGEWVKFRNRKHGASSACIDGNKFVVFNLNHDQVGNRVRGERLCMLVNTERVKLGAAALLLSPYIPMLFMGEEYADESPFYYFVSHSNAELVEAVRKGRKEEFKDFKDEGEPPDPQDEKTFTDSILQWHKKSEGKHAVILEWHRQLIALRRTHPVLKNFRKSDVRVTILNSSAFVLHRQNEKGTKHLLCFFNFSEEEVLCAVSGISSHWQKILDSCDVPWKVDNNMTKPAADIVQGGEKLRLLPLSVVLYESALPEAKSDERELTSKYQSYSA